MKTFYHFSILLSFIFYSYNVTASVKSFYVDVERDSNLRLRSKDNIEKVVNALKRHEVVMAISDVENYKEDKIIKHNGEEYLLVRKVLFPTLICHQFARDDTPYLDLFTNIESDKDFFDYKKKSKFQNCPLLDFTFPKEERKRAWHQLGSSEKLSDIIGYVPTKHLKQFSVPDSFGEKHEQFLNKNGYRVVAPHDFSYFMKTTYKQYHGFDGELVSTFFINKGHFFLPVYSENFKKIKLQRYESFKNETEFWGYKPVVKAKDKFLLHLVKMKESGKRSVER